MKVLTFNLLQLAIDTLIVAIEPNLAAGVGDAAL